MAELQAAIDLLSGSISDAFVAITATIETETAQVLAAIAAGGTSVPQAVVDQVVNMRTALLANVTTIQKNIADTVLPA
jgi:hypothetical protein